MATRAHFSRRLYELMSSMRFAISLLTVIAIASIIGTVMKQGEPYTNYVFQFGEYWFRLFEALGLYDVYHASWFLVILTFLVTSTSVRVYRNTPSMLKEMRTFKEKASETSLKNFAHRVEFSAALTDGSAAEYAVEFNEFRPFNVENLGGASDKPANATAPVNALSVKPGGLSSLPSKKDLRNVGPSFQYRLRNAQGQAREYTNYMLPVRLKGRWYFLAGVRESPNEPFRYMRIPGDGNGAIDSFMRFNATLAKPAERTAAARRFVDKAMTGDAISETLREKLFESTDKVLTIFARHGFDAVASFLESVVPQAVRENAAETYVKILEGAAAEIFAISRERAGLPPVAKDEDTIRFTRDSLNAASDIHTYGSPVYLQLASYEEVKASGLQLTRSPGRNIVYLGAILLVAGIFAMFYIHERRLFLLVKRAEGQVLMAMSTNRKNLDFEREFEKHRREIGQLLKA